MTANSAITFPSDGFGYLLGVCFADNIPSLLLVGKQPPEVHYPFPRTESESLESAISKSGTPVEILIEDRHSWVDSIESENSVVLHEFQSIPGRQLVTDSIVVSSHGSADGKSETDTGISVEENTYDRYAFLEEKYGISLEN